MPQRLFLHIGIHKTGSTAVQRFLARSENLLLEQDVLYPHSGRPARKAIADGQHLLIPELRRPGPRGTRAWDSLAKELEEADQGTVVISSENFDLLSEPGQIADLRERLAGFEVSVVVYLRRQDEFLHSYFCLDVLFHGETRSFDEYRRAPKTEPDYERLLAPWERSFGLESLIVRPYEKPALAEGDVVADFCAQIGVDPGEPAATRATPNPINRTYPRNVINCVLLARRGGMAEDEIAELRHLFAAVYRNRKVAADYLSPAQRDSLLAEFDASNRAVAKRYLGTDGPLFAALDTGDEQAWQRRYGGALADVSASVADARAVLARRGRAGTGGPRHPTPRKAATPGSRPRPRARWSQNRPSADT